MGSQPVNCVQVWKVISSSVTMCCIIHRLSNGMYQRQRLAQVEVLMALVFFRLKGA